MKKALAILVLGSFLFSPHAHAAVAPAPVVVSSAAAVADFWLFAGAVGAGIAITYLDANGIPFPLCGVAGATCTYTYPEAVHRDGV